MNDLMLIQCLLAAANARLQRSFAAAARAGRADDLARLQAEVWFAQRDGCSLSESLRLLWRAQTAALPEAQGLRSARRSATYARWRAQSASAQAALTAAQQEEADAAAAERA